MMRWCRRVCRAVFSREPIYMDGLYVSMRVRMGLSFEEAVREKGNLNRQALLDWYRGE